MSLFVTHRMLGYVIKPLLIMWRSQHRIPSPFMVVKVTFFAIVIPNIIGRFLCWDYGGGPCYSCCYVLPSSLPFPALYGVWFVIGSKQRWQWPEGGSKCVGEIPVGDISASCYWNQNKTPKLCLSYCGSSCGRCFSCQRPLFFYFPSRKKHSAGREWENRRSISPIALETSSTVTQFSAFLTEEDRVAVVETR